MVAKVERDEVEASQLWITKLHCGGGLRRRKCYKTSGLTLEHLAADVNRVNEEDGWESPVYRLCFGVCRGSNGVFEVGFSGARLDFDRRHCG